MASVLTDDIFTIRDRTSGLLLAVVTFDRFDANRPTPERPDTWG